MEEKDKETLEDQELSSEAEEGSFSTWLQENLRMLISIVIVVAIAAGIYAYSKRTQAPSIGPEEEQIAQEEETEGKISILGEEKQPSAESDQEKIAGEQTQQATPTEQQPASKQPATVPGEAAKPAEKPAPEKVITSPESQETEEAFIETAGKGDSTTVLARRALSHYLEKNPDSSIIKEHRIYIEDYLRRRVENGLIHVGESRTFQKSMISEAIQKAKELNDQQLKNLSKYAAKVSSF